MNTTQGEHAQTEALRRAKIIRDWCTDCRIPLPSDDECARLVAALTAAPSASDALRTLRDATLKGLSHAELLEKAHYLMEMNSNQARTIGELQDLVEAAPAQPAAPQGVAEAPKVYLSVNQLLQAIEFATGGAPANADELETSICFQIGHSQDDDGKVIHGMRCWLADYPEEGVYPLDEEPTAKDLADHALRASHGQAPAGATPGLPVEQEPKYTVDGAHIVNRHTCEAVPHDEPVFVFRARDALGVRALEAYLALIGESEPSSAHADAVRGRIADFQRFAERHSDRMKWPDTAQTAQAAPAAGAVAGPTSDLHPEKCPITGRPFFMTLDHPELGVVPTYGGPYDSYTIPAPEGEPTDPWHERELRSERYDHDAGWWVEGGEPIPLRIVHEDVLFKLQEDAEAAAAPTPAAQADSQPAPPTDYPTLPEPSATGLGDEYEAFDRTGRAMGKTYETILYFKADQMRAYVDADREARKQGGV